MANAHTRSHRILTANVGLMDNQGIPTAGEFSHQMIKKMLTALVVPLCVSWSGMAEETPKLKTRTNAPVFKKLYKGINIDTARPDNGVWPKIQHDVQHFKAAADAGFESVRVFLPFSANHKSTEQQIKDALSNRLAIVVCMWGLHSWPQNPNQGAQALAKRWARLAELWEEYPGDLVFELLNEPEGIGFLKTSDAPKAILLYNAAAQAIRDVDPDRPILIGAPGYNDSEFLDPYVTEQYLTYKFGDGKGFYDDENTGVAIHFYSPKHKDGVNFAMWIQPLKRTNWKPPILKEITSASKWRDRIGVNIPIITTEWGCWLFPERSEQELTEWLDYHMSNFSTYDIGNMWYTGVQNNQRTFAILNSELGWNQTVLDKLTGVKPKITPRISQVINGEFFKPDHAWEVTTEDISRQYIYGKEAFSGTSMLRLTVPAQTGGQLYLQTYKDRRGYMGAPGRTLIHLIKGQTYKVSFIAASEDGNGQMKVMLKNADTLDAIYDSSKTDGDYINIGKEPRTYTKLYTHNAETEMDVRLEFDFGPKQQVLYLDKVDLVRE